MLVLVGYRWPGEKTECVKMLSGDIGDIEECFEEAISKEHLILESEYTERQDEYESTPIDERRGMSAELVKLRKKLRSWPELLWVLPDPRRRNEFHQADSTG